mmetsp:Transcript_32531/g.59661  ORF Transcript_32531/g.59661 Transcript_32531/m.59661 type:complete len:131 (+) Transcript_32531:809-1201(+)
MWKEWEMQQDEIISRVEMKSSQQHHHQQQRGIGSRRSGRIGGGGYPGDSSLGSVISTAVDTPFSVDTPFLGAVSDTDTGEARVYDDEEDVSPTKQRMPFNNLSPRAIKEAKMKRNAQRLHIFYRRPTRAH